MNCTIPGNLGGRRCANDYLPEVTNILLVPRGTNEIEWATKSAMTSADVIAKINAANPINRLLPIKDIENYQPTEGDAKIQTFDSQRKAFIKRGVITISGLISTGDNITVENFNDLNNLNMGCILMDSEKFQYETDSATKTKVRGMKIARGSFVAKLVPATPTTVEAVQFSFDIDMSVDTKLFRIASFEELGYSLADICEPLIPIDTISGTAKATGGTVTLMDERGLPISGLNSSVTTEIVVYNETTASAVTVTGSTESNGVYSLTWSTGVTAGNSVRYSVSATGFDSYNKTVTVTVS